MNWEKRKRGGGSIYKIIEEITYVIEGNMERKCWIIMIGRICEIQEIREKWNEKIQNNISWWMNTK